MALFGGNKGSSATKTSKAEELEADLLSAIEGVQGRGRYGWGLCVSWCSYVASGRMASAVGFKLIPMFAHIEPDACLRDDHQATLCRRLSAQTNRCFICSVNAHRF